MAEMNHMHAWNECITGINLKRHVSICSFENQIYLAINDQITNSCRCIKAVST